MGVQTLTSGNTLRESLVESLRNTLSPRRKLLAEFRASWSRPGTKDSWLVSRHFDLTRGAPSVAVVDDKTWGDLEYPAIFAALDSTITPLGSQVLFKKLRSYVDDSADLADDYRGYETLRRDPGLREAVQLMLARIRTDSHATIADYIFGEPPVKPRYAALAVVQSLLSVAAPIALMTLSASPLLWIAAVMMNAAITFVVSPRLHREVEALKDCTSLLSVADGLGALGARTPSSCAQLNRLCAEMSARLQVRRAFRYFKLSRGSTVTEALALWINLLFLTDLLAYIRIVDRFLQFRPVLASTFELVGSLDADIAIASFLERNPDHCQPSIDAEPIIDLQCAYHPLLVKPVKSSVRLEGRSALVTGSNMAGKTTFIKTVGTNIILGRTLGFCLASRATVPKSTVMASIRGEHSVETGKSHYFAEIEAIKTFFTCATRGECRVFLIDELFSGTNTTERLAAARAVLEQLCKEAQVLVTTHDIELQVALGERFDLYHFLEDPDIEGFFDYQLRPGVTQERNAIRLLARMDFPVEVVRKALAYSARGIDR
ncbi:MAG TPA: hypothetical protein VMD03_04235 [Steroidobacteraceae bacterium]|nr:hypothetical protein [Steroidobacteraceae bacterium]